MAYGSVLSLLQTLEQLQQTNPELIWGQTAEMLDFLHATAEYFKNVLEDTSKIRRSDDDAEKINSLEEKIRVAASDAEDVVELNYYQFFKGLSLKLGAARKNFPDKDLKLVVEKMDTTKKQVMELLSCFSSSTHDADADDDDQILELPGDSIIGKSSTSNNPMENPEETIVQGLDDDLKKILKRLIFPPSDLDIVTISGMGGIGKTTLARKVHDHPEIRYHFDIHVWITISQEFRPRTVLLDALGCISKKLNVVDQIDKKTKNNELADMVQKKLKNRRYLFVVDDIWSMDVWDSIRGIFPDYNNGSRILLTTRETKVAMHANTSSSHEMKLLNLDNSWKLLRDKVFGAKHDYPPELEGIGKKIVEKCQGLPLTILVIAGHLFKMESTLESWKDVAKTLDKIVVSHQDKCLGVLGLSYHHLPIHLKPCFLSMGNFPEDFHIETWRLIQLWIAEGFIRTSGGCKKTLEEVAEDYLEDLTSRNLILVRKRRFNGEIKACAMHDLMREFCLKQANATKFMHVERTQGIVHTLPAQNYDVRRFSLQTQYSYVANNCCKQLPHVARSIYSFRLVVGPSIARFNLLRVLAIFNRGFSSFPLEITKLFQLRYLAITCDSHFPSSISGLQNLQTLIHDRSFYYRMSCGASVNIWMMKNLRHIHFHRGSYLTGPSRECIQNKYGVSGMPNLEELSGLSSTSCKNEVFSGTPNLKRLIVWVTYSSTDYLIDMSSLKKLEALKCFRECVSKDSIKRFDFPTSLKRLTLAGRFHFLWEDISTLVMLPNLEELKLKDHAVSGTEWRLSDEEQFQSLKLLLLNELDFQIWEATCNSFPNLKHLVLKNCKNLKQIPIDFTEIFTLESIALHDCGTAVEGSARDIEQEQEDMGNNPLKVYIHNSCNDVVELKFCQFAKVSRLTLGVLQHWDLLTVVEKMDLTKKQVMEILSHDADQILELSGDSGISTSFTSYALVSDQLGDDIVHELDDDLEIIVNRLKGQSSDLDIVTITVMGGIGKTTLAKKVYDHFSIRFPISTDATSSVEGFNEFTVSPTHPFYLHPSYSPGSRLVSPSFDGTGFEVWRKNMLTTLSAKNKLGIVTGIVLKPALNSLYFPFYERCNDMIIAWITNYLSTDLATSVMCFNMTKDIWLDINERFCDTGQMALLSFDDIFGGQHIESQDLVTSRIREHTCRDHFWHLMEECHVWKLAWSIRDLMTHDLGQHLMAHDF
ncbi:hypothetical protein T459_13844 [Capsicum annuum]|uniref:NB-ARC domain-containing protein n=1 Tax=Capsicum annuum TaxID=4072 RepID=A0A2G2ZFP6_CAPAN|nr:hypothetical protein T459_13844 [Capsicum annuum]